jgi:hypothetical protein
MSTPNPFAPFAFDFPVVMTVNGVQPQAPANLLSQLLAAVAVQQPGYTANLPGSLIDDVSGTQVASIVLCDQARVETINSLTPFGANLFILTQLGNVYGVSQGSVNNTSVLVVFSGTVGYVIPNGLLIGDGTNTYQVQGGGVIGTGGVSPAIAAISLVAGSFSVPANTVTQILTSVPVGITLTVNNPLPGSPGTGAESASSFRSRVLTAGLSACVGGPRFIKTMIGQILGAQSNLISVQKGVGGLRIVVGGSADPFQIAYAIFQSVADVTTLQPSAINPARNVTVSLIDPPDTYNVLYVNSPAQTVTMTVTWNTVLPSFTGGAAFPGLVQAPLAAYINSLGIGQVINVFEMNEIFQQAVENVLDASLLTRLVFTVSINTVVTPPGTGTGAITGDAEGYFTCAPSNITVVQG